MVKDKEAELEGKQDLVDDIKAEEKAHNKKLEKEPEQLDDIDKKFKEKEAKLNLELKKEQHKNKLAELRKTVKAEKKKRTVTFKKFFGFGRDDF